MRLFSKKLAFWAASTAEVCRKTTLLILLFAGLSFSAFAQNSTSATGTSTTPTFSLGVQAGYDLPLFSTPYQELEYRGNRYLGGQMDLRFPANWGIRLGYANILTTPKIMIPNTIYDLAGNPEAVTKDQMKLKRHFVGLGPSYIFDFGASRLSLLVAPMGGYSWLSGGDALAETATSGIQLVNTGFEDGAIAAKLDVELDFAISDRLTIGLGLYYLRHFGVHLDNSLEINNTGIIPLAHGENVFDHTVNAYTQTTIPPMVVMQSIEEPKCMDLQSVGANLSLKYTFGPAKPKQESSSDCVVCGCPDDDHKVIVTVIDEPTNKVIPEADVAIKDMTGNIVATGTTNTFGVVDFGAVPHGDYIVVGQVYDIETTVASLTKDEFVPDAIVYKEVYYNDLRFILRGKVINLNTRNAEPNVVVSLTNDQSGAVKQNNSDGQGEFSFRLDQNASYEIVGNKANLLSDIERASTIGLTRSTTLFVDLELGVEDFDCGLGTVLDIKYEFDKDVLTVNSKFELDRLVRYMQYHQVSRIELSSHTDSRGTHTYNQDLSERRAQSAVSYIISKGIPGNRIMARGYGETRLLNRCADGANCTEDEHLINRRTEAKLLCN